MMRPAQETGCAGRTLGAVLLANSIAPTTSMARETGIDVSVISGFKTGRRCPTRHQKTKLEKLYGIPVESWSEVAP